MEIKYENLTLELNEEGNYTIISCDKDVTEVNVPAEVNGVYITKIGNGAFKDCDKLVSITFQDDFDLFESKKTINEIGDGAFSGCTSLLRFDIPRAVTIIGRETFYNCISLTEVTHDDFEEFEIGYVGTESFCNCKELVTLPIIQRIGESAFSGCAKLGTIPLELSCYEIGEKSFAYCESLTEVKLSSLLWQINGMAFRGCHNLKRVEFEDTKNWYVHFDEFADLCDMKNAKDNNSPFGDYGIVEQIDVTNPESNARTLSTVDYDDGVLGYFCK